MARLLPSTPDLSSLEDTGPRVIGIDGDDADDLLTAMSSGTARDLLSELHDEPAPPSELADAIDTSLQNAQYHLGRLEEAGAVEVIDTVYSEKGREMKVYGPTDKPLVVVAGSDTETAGLKQAVMNLLGGLGLVGIVSVGIQVLVDQTQLGRAGGDGGQAAPTGGGELTVQDTAAATPEAAAGGGLTADVLLEPGILFFLGGLTVLLIGFTPWYLRRPR